MLPAKCKWLHFSWATLYTCGIKLQLNSAFPYYLTNNCAVNNYVDFLYIFFTKSTEYFSKPVTQNKSYTVTMSEFT